MYHERFEKAFADYVGVRYAMALPSCTSAIHLSLLALGVGPGDEVIVPDITWIASSAPVFYVGATPVFADIDPETWCLSAESFEACITPRTKAAIPVDLYGGMPDMDALQTIARRHNIAIIEDAAEALGAEYKGKKAGGLDIGATATGCAKCAQESPSARLLSTMAPTLLEKAIPAALLLVQLLGANYKYTELAK
jgi:perosamine synthetase